MPRFIFLKCIKKINKELQIETINNHNCRFIYDKCFLRTLYAKMLHLISDDHPAEATFRGGEYIAYDLQQRGVEPILSTNDEISLYFKTRKSSGLLFYTGSRKFKCRR